MTVKLHGYQYSVYSWIARLALQEKGVSYEWVEVNPFADDVPRDYLTMHPFKRVPTLVDGEFVVFERMRSPDTSMKRSAVQDSSRSSSKIGRGLASSSP
ncbi:MAG: glutathione S-transferase N-terminal domain-containing protein [Bradyrhizobium sp.]